jgi:hypothetical protein
MPLSHLDASLAFMKPANVQWLRAVAQATAGFMIGAVCQNDELGAMPFSNCGKGSGTLLGPRVVAGWLARICCAKKDTCVCASRLVAASARACLFARFARMYGQDAGLMFERCTISKNQQ